MDLGALRTLTRDVNFAVFGVPITVNRHTVDEEPIVTSGIWESADTEGLPGGIEFQRRDPIRAMAISRDVVSTVPRGTVIMAPERVGTVIRRWRTDGIARMDVDKVHVVLVPDFDLES